jgi:hypothetical protein
MGFLAPKRKHDLAVATLGGRAGGGVRWGCSCSAVVVAYFFAGVGRPVE